MSLKQYYKQVVRNFPNNLFLLKLYELRFYDKNWKLIYFVKNNQGKSILFVQYLDKLFLKVKK